MTVVIVTLLQPREYSPTDFTQAEAYANNKLMSIKIKILHLTFCSSTVDKWFRRSCMRIHLSCSFSLSMSREYIIKKGPSQENHISRYTAHIQYIMQSTWPEKLSQYRNLPTNCIPGELQFDSRQRRCTCLFHRVPTECVARPARRDTGPLSPGAND
jgi:hypothetical protein